MKGLKKVPKNPSVSKVQKKADTFAKEARARVDRFAKGTGA